MLDDLEVRTVAGIERLEGLRTRLERLSSKTSGRRIVEMLGRSCSLFLRLGWSARFVICLSVRQAEPLRLTVFDLAISPPTAALASRGVLGTRELAWSLRGTREDIATSDESTGMLHGSHCSTSSQQNRGCQRLHRLRMKVH